MSSLLTAMRQKRETKEKYFHGRMRLSWNWTVLSILPFLPMKDDSTLSNQHHLFMSDQNNVYFSSFLSSDSTLAC